MKNKKKTTHQRIKKDLEIFRNLKKYTDKDDQDYKWKRYIENLSNKIDEDYYKPIKTKSAFDNNYIEYESRGDKDKNLPPEYYLDIIRPYLRDMTKYYKASNGITFRRMENSVNNANHFYFFLDTGEISAMDM